MAKRDTRNTRTHYRCRTCEGAGEVEVNHSRFYATGRQDPQCDEPAPCPNLACDGGWVRFAPVDALAAMRKARQLYLRGRRSPILAANYRKARAAALKPVRLPPDEVANPLFRQARSDVEAAIQMFWPGPAFGAIFGEPVRAAA